MGAKLPVVESSPPDDRRVSKEGSSCMCQLHMSNAPVIDAPCRFLSAFWLHTAGPHPEELQKLVQSEKLSNHLFFLSINAQTTNCGRRLLAAKLNPQQREY